MSDQLRLLKEADREQRREGARLEKERRQEERRREQEARKRDKEIRKVLAHQERAVTRLRGRGDAGAHGAPDDLDLEYEQLAAAYRSQMGLPEDQPLPGELVRPAFPPASLQLQPAFPPQLGDEAGAQVLLVWSLMFSFPDVLGIQPPSVDQLVAALLAGQASRLLGSVHIALLHTLAADMEEGHALAATASGRDIGDKGATSSEASRLDEALAWGIDMDSWRAHLNHATWPEVLRWAATIGGAAGKRPRARPKSKEGTEGEDIVAAGEGAAGLKLRLPERFSRNSVKAAVWQVLAEAGAEGMTIPDMVAAIQARGLRDLSTSKTPEASVAGALSRDVIFHHHPRRHGERARYALKALVNQARRAERAQRMEAEAAAARASSGAGAGAPPGPAAAVPGPGAVVGGQQQGAGAASASGTSPSAAAGTTPAPPALPPGEEEDDEYYDEEDEEEDRGGGASGSGEPWALALRESDYASLSTSDRLAALCFLCHAVLEGHSVRLKLEAREEARERTKRKLWDEAKASKKRRQAEAAAKAQLAGVEAARRLEALRAAAQGLPPPGRGPLDEAAAQAAEAAGSSLSSPMAIVDQLFRDPNLLLAYDTQLVADMAVDAAQARYKAEIDEAETAKRQRHADTIRGVCSSCMQCTNWFGFCTQPTHPFP